MSLSDRLRSLLAELVAFDTQNPSGDDQAVVRWLAMQLVCVNVAAIDGGVAFNVVPSHEYVELTQLIEAHDTLVEILGRS